jgi:hypothetical protein
MADAVKIIGVCVAAVVIALVGMLIEESGDGGRKQK